MDSATKATFRSLLALPVAALGTLHDGAPFVSMTPLVPDPGRTGFFIHVSRLAQHTRDLVVDGRVSLLFMQPLDADQDPLALPRLTLQGAAEAIPTDSEGHESAAEAYLARFPQAEMTLHLDDFSFFLIRPATGRLVSGFGRALSLDAAEIHMGLSLLA